MTGGHGSAGFVCAGEGAFFPGEFVEKKCRGQRGCGDQNLGLHPTPDQFLGRGTGSCATHHGSRFMMEGTTFVVSQERLLLREALLNPALARPSAFLLPTTY